MTLVYQIDSGRKRLIGVLRERTTKTLEDFFTAEDFGAERCRQIKMVCSDMWRPYLKVIAKCLPNALNVLDRFHIAKKLGEAVDQVRREETKDLHEKGYFSGIVEGLNLKINMGIRKAYGDRSFDIMKVALLHQLGDLPEPKPKHRFC